MEETEGIALSPRPGTVDAAFLGVRPGGPPSNGVMATMTFIAVAAGNPAIRIASVDARDAANHSVNLAVDVPPAPRTVPAVTSLSLAGPNPFRDATALSLALAQSGPVEVVIYSVTGQRVRTLLSGMQEPGEYRLPWDGRDENGRYVAAGVYYVRLAAPSRHLTRPVIVLR
jgi:hypothetical protein